MKASDFFFRLGRTAWFLGAGGALLLAILGWLGALHLAHFDWRLFALVFGTGGLAAMIIGGVCLIWER